MRTMVPDQDAKYEINTAESIAAPKPGVGNNWEKVSLPLPPKGFRDPYDTTIVELRAALAELTGSLHIEIGRALADGRLLQGTIQWMELSQWVMGIEVSGIREICPCGPLKEFGGDVNLYFLDLWQGFRLEWRTKSKSALMICAREGRWIRIGKLYTHGEE